MKIRKIEIKKGNPLKDALPDIDEDVASSRRDDVKRYMEDQFGKEHVVSIGTFGRMKLRSIIKDFAREKGFSFDYINKITKNIDDQVEGYEWSDLFKYALRDEVLYNFVQKNPQLINNIKQVLNNPRSSSIHPSALIIVPRKDKDGNDSDLFNMMPVRAIDGVLVGEWEGKYTDMAGFLKEDILGITQLDKFDEIIKLIQKNRGIKVVLDDIDLDANDEEVFEAFSNGFNEDVFQFGSFGLKNYSREVKPDCLEDLIAMNALYRPATMDVGAHKDFALIKQGKKKAKYDFGLEEVTKDTNGLYIYQEQLMRACIVLGGFSGAEAESVRTACKKFDKKALSSLKEKFILGAIRQNCPEDEAEKVWEKMIAFAGYGFNKCSSGKTTIYRFTGNTYQPKEISIEKFYELAYSNKTSTSKKYRIQKHFGFVRFYDPQTKKIKYSKVKAIHKNGIKKTHRVLLKNGMFIDATLDHRLLRDDEKYVEIKKLKIGDSLIVCGEKDKNFNSQSREDKGIGSGWVAKTITRGENNRPIIDGRHKRVIQCQLNALQRANGKCEECFSIENGRMEFHHKDGNHYNDVEENVQYVCNSCHKKLDYKIGKRSGDRNLGYFSEISEIVSIEYVGEEETYDLEMFEEPHNYIANGIVSHNSHSTAYAITAYWCQHLKVKYPLEFFTISLNYASTEDISHVLKEIDEANYDIQVASPNVNVSSDRFVCSVEDNKIYWSIEKIKGIGAVATKAIVDERNNNGGFYSLKEFLSRVTSKVNKKVVRCLILSGAFDDIYDIKRESGRLSILREFYELRKEDPLKDEVFTNANNEKDHYFSLLKKELTGYSFIDFESIVSNSEAIDSKQVNFYVDIKRLMKKKPVSNSTDLYGVCGFLQHYKERETKKDKKPFGILEVENNNTIIEVIVWNDQWKTMYKQIEKSKGEIIYITGNLRKDDYRNRNHLFSCDKTKIYTL